MKRITMRISLIIVFASLFVFGVIFAGGPGSSGSIVSTVQAADDVDGGGCRRNSTIQLISESALLSGLAPGALFPFIDSTPNSMVSAHIAITDATTTCAAGAAPPANIQILVGQAGVELVPVMTAATNTGISTTAAQCVFHVTVTPGSGGVPETATDIVVVNGNPSVALTGVNTITASAEVCVRRSPGKKQ